MIYYQLTINRQIRYNMLWLILRIYALVGVFSQGQFIF